jgi:hypothetical protein
MKEPTNQIRQVVEDTNRQFERTADHKPAIDIRKGGLYDLNDNVNISDYREEGGKRCKDLTR